MKTILGSLLLTTAFLFGCETSPADDKTFPSEEEAWALPEAPSPAQEGGPDYGDMDPLNGKEITLTGTFDHAGFTHGILTLDGGLKVTLLHFDAFRKGDDWLKYVGKQCAATGIFQTFTRDIDGYRGPSLDLRDFDGPGD